MGSTFTLTLPAIQDDHVGSPAPREDPPASEALGTFPGLSIVVVDDAPDSRELVKRLLQGGGAQVSVAATAQEALDLVEAQRPDLLISDIGMPDEDGYALIRKLRARPAPHGGDTVAIALTAYARAEDRATALRAGFQYHVSKPIEPLELFAVVALAAKRVATRS
jgi:CheY-like chemotaxis protein